MTYKDWIDGFGDDDSFVSEIKKYITDNYSWAEYVVVIDDRGKSRPEIKDWCSKNLIGRYDFECVSYFELEEDSVIYGLRWV